MKTLKITSIIASAFSVIFSLSLVLEISKYITGIGLILTTLFLFLFIVYNEISKVSELKKFYKNQKSNLVTIIVSISMSVILSGVGIIFWTNSTIKEKDDLAIETQIKVKEINQKYVILSDSIDKIKTPEYEQILKDLEFWRNRKSGSKEQRQEVWQNIRNLERKRSEAYITIENKRTYSQTILNSQKADELKLLSEQKNKKQNNMTKNNFLTILFFCMVLISEFIIVNVNKQIIQFYTEEQRSLINVLKDLELRNITNVSLNEFKFNRFNLFFKEFKNQTHNDFMWEQTKKDYNLLFELSILDKEMNLMVKKPSKFLENYFNNINSF